MKKIYDKQEEKKNRKEKGRRQRRKKGGKGEIINGTANDKI